MSLIKITADDDKILRERVICMMNLRNEKLTNLARKLNLDTGGLSGWVNGGVQGRLSIKKKSLVSDYLGLLHGFLAPNKVHVWNTDSETIESAIPLLLSKELLNGIRIVPIYSAGQPASCALLASSMNDYFVVIAEPRDNSLQPPIITPEKTGWGVLESKAIFSTAEYRKLKEDKDMNISEIYLEIMIRSMTKIDSSMIDWVILVKEAVIGGLTVDEARKRLLD